jgi:hypothetical protein
MRAIGRAAVSALVLCSGLAMAQSTQPVTETRVAQAIARDLGAHTQDAMAQARIEILASALRMPQGAQLHVAAVHAFAGAKTWLLRLECGSRLECLPFEVALRLRGSDNGAGLALRHGSMLSTPLAQLSAPVVRSGEKVRLAEEVSGMRLSAPAVCLQSGSIGQKIRVRNVSSGRVVLARVRGAGRVAVEQ